VVPTKEREELVVKCASQTKKIRVPDLITFLAFDGPGTRNWHAQRSSTRSAPYIPVFQGLMVGSGRYESHPDSSGEWEATLDHVTEFYPKRLPRGFGGCRAVIGRFGVFSFYVLMNST